MAIYIPPDRSFKRRAIKFARNAIISIIVLIVLFGGAGVAYTWYMGQKPESSKTASVGINYKPRKEKQPYQPAADAQIGASVQSFTSPVTPGSNASITVRTNAKAKCTIEMVYGDPHSGKTITSKDSGLAPKTADAYGMVTWSWTVEPNVPLGKWPVKALCANTKHSAAVSPPLEIVKTLPTGQDSVLQ